MAGPPTNAAALEGAILHFLSQSDGALVRAAEAALQPLLSSKGGADALFAVACGSAHEGARHAAAIFLRHFILPMWNRRVADRGALQGALLQRLAGEPSRVVRMALMGSVAALARVLLPGGAGWPELLALLSGAAGAPQEEFRELAQQLVEELAHSVGPGLRRALPALAPVQAAALADGAPRVRLAALRATCMLLAAVERRDAAPFAGALPALLAATGAALGMGVGGGGGGGAAEGAALVALEALEALVDAGSPVLEGDPGAYEALLRAALAAAEGGHLEPGTRGAACDLAKAVVARKPLYVARRGLVGEPLLGAVLRLVEGAWDGEEDAELAVEAAAAGLGPHAAVAHDRLDNVALGLLEEAARALPGRALFPALLGAAGAALGGGAPPRTRRAALAALGRAAEGLSESYQRALPRVLALLLPSLRDGAVEVREAAAGAVAQVCAAAQPRVAHAHPLLLPALGAALRDPCPGVATRACWAVEALGDCLPADAAAAFAQEAVPALGALLAPASGASGVLVLAALSSLAVAMGGHFAPYLPAVAPPLLALAGEDAPARAPLRAAATQALGFIVAAVGAGGAAAVGESLLGAAAAAAAAGLATDASEVREAGFRFFSCLAGVAGESTSFTGFLPQLMEGALAAAEKETEWGVASDGADCGALGAFGARAAAAAAAGAAAGGSADGDDDKEEEEEGGEEGGGAFPVHVRAPAESESELRIGALICVGKCLAHAPPAALAPYLPRAAALLDALSADWHQGVAAAAVDAQQGLVKAMCRAAPAGAWPAPWVEQFNVLLTGAEARLRESAEEEVVKATCDALQEWAKDAGGGALAPHLRVLVKLLQRVLKGEAPCQRGEDDSDDEEEEEEEEDDDSDDEEEEEEEEEAPWDAPGGAAALPGGTDDCGGEDHDSLLDYAADALCAVAQASGACFLPHLPSTVAIFLKLAVRGGDSEAGRALGLGSLAELLAPPLGPAVFGPGGLPPATQARILDVFLTRVRAPGGGGGGGYALQNAVFGLGQLVEAAPAATVGGAPVVLAALAPLANAPRGCGDEADLIIDNALGALCRCAAAWRDAVPTPPLLMVLFAQLPLRRDTQEATPVLRALASLLMRRDPAAVAPGALERVLAQLAAALAGEGAGAPPRELKEELRAALAMAHAAAAAAGSPEEKAAWAQAMGSA